jgi:ABC-type Mn2+/Zn2+ transport system ATPase subunit
MKIIFEKIVHGKIFCEEYKNLQENNELDFSNKKVAVLYGANGTGKTSLAMVLGQEKETEYSITIDGKKYTEKDKIAHVINDQNARNIIQGNTEDFILGDKIKEEQKLKKCIEDNFPKLFDSINLELKNKFGINTIKSNFDIIIKNDNLKNFISDIANSKSKGIKSGKIEKGSFLDVINSLSQVDIPEYDVTKFNFLVTDYKSKNPIIISFDEINFNILKEEKGFTKISESNDAISILKKYDYSDDCIVCDNVNIQRESLITKKENQKESALKSLSEESKKIIEKIINKIEHDNDPFNLKESLTLSLKNGKSDDLKAIKSELEHYKNIFNNEINNLFVKSVHDSNLIAIYAEYEKLIKEKPEFENEDIIFIENFLNECLDRKITLVRDENNNIKLLLGDKEFLNSERKELFLSNGEQNFLSLAFELLKAKKVNQEIIILDDPISSFDSIYKNKIAYAILKFLDSKKSIILTHNTDLIKLLEHQEQKKFNLYYFNNSSGESNGFIYTNENELEILIYIHKFLKLLRDKIQYEIIDEKLFLISILPFMRGYCYIIDDKQSKDELTKLMHGYQTTTINITEIYKKLFSNAVIKNDYIISAQDIVNLDINLIGDDIIKNCNYPLLSKTLNHTLTYLYLRLNVEKKLVDKFAININKKCYMLNHIIFKAFSHSDTSPDNIKNRVFFLSKKTLLNEFNHFEMDMNIFQPAIDITNQALKKEKEDILLKLSEI